MSSNYRIDVNGQWVFDMDEQTLQPYDIARTGPDSCHVLKDHHPYEVRIDQAEFNRKRYRVSVNGKSYSIEIANALDQLIDQMGFEMGAASAISRIEAPMPGLILDIVVSEGDEVREGDALLVLEAMKMENMILSPRDGVIGKLAVSKGAAVDKKDLLVEFE